MKILDAAATLNDGFTACMKIEIQGRVFYLLKDDVLEGSGRRKLGFMRIVKDVTVLNDTVRLTSSNLMFYSPDQKIHHALQAGKVTHTVF